MSAEIWAAVIVGAAGGAVGGLLWGLVDRLLSRRGHVSSRLRTLGALVAVVAGIAALNATGLSDCLARALGSRRSTTSTALGSPPPAAARSTAASPPAVPGLTYRFEKVAEGVFCAIPSGTPYYVANSVVVVGDDGVLVVDPGATPSQARVLRDAMRTLTDRPVRYVVDTHFHFDHAFGNAAFPEASIIGHVAARGMLGSAALRERTVAEHLASVPARIEEARAMVAKEAKTAVAKEANATEPTEAALRLAAWEAYQKELAALVPIAPHLTFDDHLTLWLGRREIRLLHLGRGHTASDIVVFLPLERVACTGDLFNGYIGYMGDAYVDEWAASLDRLAALDFDTAVPGHGKPVQGKDAIPRVQACLRDLWRQAEAFARAGVPAERAAARIDLRAHAPHFPSLAQLGFAPRAVERIYEVIDQREAARRR